MAQFSIHENRNPKTQSTYPFLVDLQSDLLRDLQTRVVVPLAKLAASVKKPIKNLTPIVGINDQKFIMLLPQLAGIPRAELGIIVGTVMAQRDEIIAAMDFLITGI